MRDRDDYKRQLKTQLDYLTSFGHSYDDGHEEIATHLAVVIRVLVHQTGSSDALLGPNMLDVLDSTPFMDTLPANPPPQPGVQLVPAMGSALLSISMTTNPEQGTGMEFRPKLGSAVARWTTFHSWWTQPASRAARGAKQFSRRDFVRALANKEGGAHVDSDVSEEYQVVTRDRGFGAVIDPATGAEVPLDSDPTYAVVRQIAYEMQQTITSELSELLPPP